MATTAGPIALAGSGEFLPQMEDVDRVLLAGRAPRAAFLPTAAALEGDERVAYWLDLGRSHYAAMGIEPVPVPVRTRQDADDPAMAALVADVGLVYLSGGDPHYLASTLRGTLVWDAIVTAWKSGTALAGCSAGAMALGSGAPSLRPGDPSTDDGHANGLGVVAALAVIPHFDLMERFRPGATERFLAWKPPGTVVVGVDEDTAIVGAADGERWEVMGRQAAWVIDAGGRTKYEAGAELAVSPLSRP